jgi:hypothetical protein
MQNAANNLLFTKEQMHTYVHTTTGSNLPILLHTPLNWRLEDTSLYTANQYVKSNWRNALCTNQKTSQIRRAPLT